MQRITGVAGPAAVMIAVQFVLFPLPAGMYLHGLALGCLASVSAVGMSLVYRANRIINFAAGQIGLVPAVVATSLSLFSGFPFVISLVVGSITAAALGAGTNVVIVRRFSQAPRLVLTVATIGLAQLLAVVALVLPGLWGKDSISVTTGKTSLPFRLSFEIDPMVVRTEHLLALIVAPALLWSVATLLRSTPTGIAVRAAAERSDRALLLGIPVSKIHTFVWALAAVMSFAAVYIRSLIVGLPLSNPMLGFSTVVVALAALILGRMDDFPSVALSAVGLGVLEQGVVWNHGDAPELVYPVYAAIVLGSLIWRRVDILRGDQDNISTWRSVDVIRPIPPVLRRLPQVRLARFGGVALFIAAVLSAPLVLGPGDEMKASAVVVYAIVGLSVVILTGWAGQVSLGQMAFAGFGAAFGSKAFLDLGWDVTLALPVAAAFGAITAVAVGLPALRFKGIFLAATTLSFAVAASGYLLSQRHMSWIPRGRIERVTVLRVVDVDSPADTYLLTSVVAILLFAAVAGIRQSRTGRVLMALRENELAAQSHGINVTKAKLTGFALSGAVAAVGGCLYTVVTFGYSETLFSPGDSLAVFTATVVGGVGSMVGAVVGAVLLRGGMWFLSGNWVYVPTAAGVLVVLWIMPGGLGAMAYSLRDRLLRSLAHRQGIEVAALGPVGSVSAGRAASLLVAQRPMAKPKGVDPQGRPLVIEAQGLDVGYGDVQVLFDVGFSVAEGEIVALLGTNGAGKSTLLKALSGLLPLGNGRILLDGEELHLPPDRVAAAGITQMPGGHGVFPSLTVTENITMACWLARGTEHDQIEMLGTRFPALARRLNDRAGDLSGGQQQMLSLAMSLIVRPRVLLIDELSLGLAPVIVEQLLEVVREVASTGTAVVLVEQSVNVALELAERAVFMEKGEVRFEGATRDLLQRPDLLRSVFLEGAAGSLVGPAGQVSTSPHQGFAPAALDNPSMTAGVGSPAGISVWERALPANHQHIPVFEVRGLTVSFGGIRAVDDVSFTIAPGELVGIIGPNGAGKTTIFDLVTGCTAADRGLILLDGVDISPMSADERSRAGLARSFQDARLYPGLTVSETLAVALDRWLPIKDPFRSAVHAPSTTAMEAEVRERVEELIGLLGLERYSDTLVQELSTGSRRVLDMACVLAHHPSIVLLDEPSSGIAQREAEALGPLLARVRDVLGASMLVIEHDMALVSSIADRMIALDQGRVVASGLPIEVLQHPSVVASYLGTNGIGAHRSGSADKAARRRAAVLAKLNSGTDQAAALDGSTGPSGPAAVPSSVTLPSAASVTSSTGSSAGASTSSEPSGSGKRPSLLKAYTRPIAAATAVLVLAVAGGLGGTGESVSRVSAAGGDNRGPDTTQPVEVPIIFSEAPGDRSGYDWVANCDTETGRISIPSLYAPPCVPRYDGDNGGSTYTGVSEDEIKVVLYVPQGESDLRAVLQNALDDPAYIEESGYAYLEMLNDVFETYGRQVVVERFDATGAMDDEVAARSDAIRIAEEIKPFASIGGPPMTTAYAEELATRGIICIDCGLAVPDSFFQKHAPFMWGPLPTPEQYLLTLGDYLLNRVQDRPAEFAGDESMHDEERVFGVIRFDQKIPVFNEVNELVETIGKARGFVPVVNEIYVFDLEKMPERATTIIAKMKAAGVTTVLFLGDPLMPIYLTQAATNQDYFPEWMVAGTVLTDTTVMGRRYDQKQWAHAFGLSNLPVQTPLEMGEAHRLHQWYFGTPPAASKTSQLILQPLVTLFLGIHLAGEDLNPYSFREGMFKYPPTGGGPTTPRFSFGRNGLFLSEDLRKRIDYLAIDDMSEIWWDPEAVGPDETGEVGKGMWRYSDGGTRYLPGEMPEGSSKAFVLEGSVLLYEEFPEGDEPPAYPSPEHM